MEHSWTSSHVQCRCMSSSPLPSHTTPPFPPPLPHYTPLPLPSHTTPLEYSIAITTNTCTSYNIYTTHKINTTYLQDFLHTTRLASQPPLPLGPYPRALPQPGLSSAKSLPQPSPPPSARCESLASVSGCLKVGLRPRHSDSLCRDGKQTI